MTEHVPGPHPFRLFGEGGSLTLGGLTVENGAERAALYLPGGPALEVARDRAGIESLRCLLGRPTELARPEDVAMALALAMLPDAGDEIRPVLRQALAELLAEPGLPARLTPAAAAGDDGTVANPFG